MDIFSFLLGLLVLYKGEFRIANRTVPRIKARQIGLLLMLPLAVGVIAALLFMPSALNDVSLTADGAVSMDTAAFEGLLNTLLVISLITFGSVIAAVFYIIYSIPPGDASARPVNPLWTPRTPPTNMPPADDPFANEEPSPAPKTPSQPAPQQRLHPLEGGGFAPAGYRPGRPQPRTVPGQPKSIMTIAEAAAYMKLTTAQVEGLIDAGQLAAAKGNGGYRIAKLAADDYLDEHRPSSAT